MTQSGGISENWVHATSRQHRHGKFSKIVSMQQQQLHCFVGRWAVIFGATFALTSAVIIKSTYFCSKNSFPRLMKGKMATQQVTHIAKISHVAPENRLISLNFTESPKSSDTLRAETFFVEIKPCTVPHTRNQAQVHLPVLSNLFHWHLSVKFCQLVCQRTLELHYISS